VQPWIQRLHTRSNYGAKYSADHCSDSADALQKRNLVTVAPLVGSHLFDRLMKGRRRRDLPDNYFTGRKGQHAR